MADFLDRMADKIDQGLKTVSAKSKELIEVGKLRGEMRDAEGLIQGRLQDLGRKVYAMVNQGALNEAELRADVEAVTALHQRVASLEKAIRDVERATQQTQLGKDMVKCASCGAANRAGDKFCGACGAPLPDLSAGIACPACATPLREGAAFCQRCGKKVDAKTG